LTSQLKTMAASPHTGLICLTTRHGKERALARPFRLGLGLTVVSCPCDTDQLGTFSGDVERPADARETCRRKARLGLEQTGLRLGLASEGSFGPHPAAAMLPVGQELLLWLDLERGVEIVEQRLELRTNFDQQVFEPDGDPIAWLDRVGFPSHGVIARPASWTPGAPLYKGLTSITELRQAIATSRSADAQGRVQLETDMRAHLNPTRMASLRRLGVALVRRLRTACPSCEAPGWGLVDTVAGLPCSWCGEPTALTRFEIWACPQCRERRLQPRADGLVSADPGQCQGCNP
jgi:hypothetical protein